MGASGLTLQQANDSTLGYVEGVLLRNNLPAQDVRSKPDCFYVGYTGDERVGIGGFERYGTDGLLRSVVVEESNRGEGLGIALYEALEARASAAGIETLYLLTTTASEFFADRGYREIDRNSAPDSIQQTTEFRFLCPMTAVCMRKYV